MEILLIILIYILTVFGWWLWTYLQFSYTIHTFGDILDLTNAFGYIPFVNTIAGVVLVCIFGVIYVLSYTIEHIIAWLKLEQLWERIRNIKIKK